MIFPEKSDIVYLLSEDDAEDLSYKRYNVKIVNMQNADILDKIPQNSISQIGTAKFDTLEIQKPFRTQSSNFPFNGFDKDSGSMQSIMSFSSIKALFMTFATSQYPTWFFPVLFTGLNLVFDQNNVIPYLYKSLNQATKGQMFDCFVDQDVVSAPSDLYHSLTFENLNVDDKKNYYGLIDNNDQYKTANIFYLTTLYSGSKAIRTLHPNKYMLAWKLATDDSFMRGYNSSKIAYPDHTKASITPMMHYLCDEFVRIIFDDSSMSQVLNIDVIGELAGGAIKPQ
ncbi:MAG: hypothetical protein EZS28_023252 [Streblomastix strix]|uniref:Uncharacterized protein n=1 Tax=Streblomastix strix TaxID=222440 RepID=A0A5J4VFJ5_9EUKA|nr:MAG: hypothetical protein EZS28_023252 [Streblomastix strix]